MCNLPVADPKLRPIRRKSSEWMLIGRSVVTAADCSRHKVLQPIL